MVRRRVTRNLDLERFALGRIDEYRTSGIRLRRIRRPEGELLERVWSDGGRSTVAFTETQRELFLQTARAQTAHELSLVVQRIGPRRPGDTIGPLKN